MKKGYYRLLLFLFSIQAFAQENPYSDPFLDSLYDISANYSYDYNYYDAITEARKLIKEAKLRDNNEYLYHAYNILGGSYTDLKDTLRAQKNYEEALRYAIKSNNDTLVLWANNNLGNIFSEDKDIEIRQLGIDYYNEAIAIARKMGIEREVLYPTNNIAWTYIDNGKYDKAGPYLWEVWDLVKGSDEEDSYLLSSINYLTGRYFVGMGQLEMAEPYFKNAISKAEKDLYLLEASLAYKEYSKLLFKLEKYEEAYLALEKFKDYNSKIFEQERLRQINIANAKFDNNDYQNNLNLAEKEQQFQAEIIEKSNEKIYIMVVSSIVLIIILIVLNKINRDRKKLIDELKIKNNELYESKNQAEHLSRLKTQFFSTVSHEIRTPLYGVVGLTSLLLEDKSLTKHQSDLKSLKFSADYLLALINDVLQMNKMESNLVKLEKVSFHLKDLMSSILNTFEFARIQNDNRIHIHIDDDIPSYLMGDPVRLSQVLMNLVGNAVKFTERGDIHLSAKLKKKNEDEMYFILFEVKDNGIGIPENKQNHIFEEFSQLNTSNYNYQGTGLGLPIVKKLLELFDSKIILESEKGKGSKFNFTIGFKKDISKKEGSAKKVENEESVMENPIPQRVLIVDDNRINQVVTSRILEKKKFICEVAGDGEEAVNKVKANDYNLVLMDLNMPGMGGLEATINIRKFNSTVSIVALTAVEVEEMREKIFKAGMDDIIVKPYDVQQFYQIIYRNISGRKIATEV
ncbi:hybrid sensor histidine kinase/response regulator [Autumnicola psychrophila]|uniref:histidine kinase n=1 Tax=Autumnicola psychrophila TaxID=3075592 RepID=A0ABU3DSS8_9FLAO|nr:response regulator [Zunongwangia sp. F225]MDT0686777.1 response regulator [Zunongwangia sp. F225]